MKHRGNAVITTMSIAATVTGERKNLCSSSAECLSVLLGVLNRLHLSEHCQFDCLEIKMERNKRLFVVARLLLVLVLFDGALLLLASAEASNSQSLRAGTVSVARIGSRFLLQDGDSINGAGGDHNHGARHLPVAIIVVGSVAVGIVFFFLLLTTIGYFQNRWEVKVVDSQQAHHEGPPTSAPPFMMAVGAPERFLYKELQSGTLNFTEKLGRSGNMFKCVLSNLTECAVKRFSEFPRAEFEQDVKKVAALHHGSLVHLFGYCSDGDHRLLVYEYLPKGSLGNYLYSSVSQPSRNILNWSTRFRIMLGTARVTAWVHERGSNDEALKVHGRIHPDNILLTENYDPKLADYGFSRPHAVRDQEMLRNSSSATAGKYEYFAPEWWAADPSPAHLTPKADVYSFGILVLEIVGGRRMGDFYMSKPSWEFPALDNVSRGEDGGESSAFTDLVDPELKGVVDISQLRSAIHVAYWCIQSDVDARPTMAAVMGFLEGRVDMETPPTPNSAVVFSPIRQNGHSASLQGFRFSRRHSRVEISG